MDLSAQLKLDEIPEPQRSTILAALTEIVLSKLALEAYDKLSAEDQAYLDGLDEGTSPDDILAFLQTRIPDLDAMTNRIIDEEKAELAQKTEQLMQTMKSQEPNQPSSANGS